MAREAYPKARVVTVHDSTQDFRSAFVADLHQCQRRPDPDFNGVALCQGEKRVAGDLVFEHSQ